jgi:diguanylate cyclase (GGDEF)-like protein/PAS domain S-box-containing protein
MFIFLSSFPLYRGDMTDSTSPEMDDKYLACLRQVASLLNALQQAESQGELSQEQREVIEDGFGELSEQINSSEALLWFVNQDKRLLLANETSRKQFFELTGVEMQPGQCSRDLLSPNVADYFDQLYGRVLQGQTLRFNHTGLNKREYAMVAQPVRTKKGIAGVSVIGQDITEVHQLQVELRQFEQVISSTPDLIAVIDRKYNHQIVNDSYLGAFNKTREEMLKLNLSDLFGKRSFQHDALLNLEIAFSGETVHTESWVELPELGRRLMAITYQPLRSQELTPKFVVFNGRDITALKQAQDERQRIFDVSLDMLCVTGFDGRFKEVNPAWARTIGWSAEELKSKSWGEFVIEEDQVETVEAYARLIKGETLVGFENRYRCKDGSVKWLSWSAYPDLERERVFSVIRDITADKEMQAELRHLATTDPLTGARNRRYFIDHVNLELKRSRRHDLPLAVFLLDIDHFKSVNDTYGHDIGDEVLIKLVDSCHMQLRETDMFGRFGGEEFAAALIQTDLEGAKLVCERLRERIKKLSFRTQKGELSISVSIGLTMLNADDLSIDTVLKRADDALYRAKNGGRDQVAVY